MSLQFTLNANLMPCHQIYQGIRYNNVWQCDTVLLQDIIFNDNIINNVIFTNIKYLYQCYVPGFKSGVTTLFTMMCSSLAYYYSLFYLKPYMSDLLC